MARSPRNFPVLMTFKEKHDDDAYIVNSEEEIHRLAVYKIRERFSGGWFVGVAAFESELQSSIGRLIERSELSADTAPRTIVELKALTGTEEERAAKLFGMEPSDLSKLPASMAKSVVEKSNSFQKSLVATIGNYDRDLDEARDIETIVVSKRAEELTKEYRGRSYNLALWVLDSRQDYEYEGFEIDSPRAIPSAEALEAGRSKI